MQYRFIKRFYISSSFVTPADKCYFLVSEQESNQRSRHRGGANAALPRDKLHPPLRTPPARTIRWCITFSRRDGTEERLAVGGGSALAALPSLFALSAMRRGIHKGARFSRSAPCVGFFWYFSCRNKKST